MKDKKPANPFLKKASGVKPPTRSAIKSQQKHGGLGRMGRGLDSLITPASPASTMPPPVVPLVPAAAPEQTGERVLQVPPWEIERSPWQPRTEFSREALEDLVESIRQNGIIQPLTCRRRADGKLELSLNDVAFRRMDSDGEIILAKLQEAGGFLPFNDKTDPELIKLEFNMSKNAFKRAIGGLYKERKIEITDKGIKTV